MIERVQKLFYTLHYLKRTQIFHLIKEKFFPRWVLRWWAVPPLPSTVNGPTRIHRVAFQFPTPPALDRQLVRRFLAGEVNPRELPLLEVFHLHYFHYLFDESLPMENRLALIRRWLERHPPGDEPAWHPYPTSLRIGNWILFYLDHPEVFEADPALNTAFLSRLWQQGAFLRRRMEYHLRANHLLENARALVMAGVFFQEQRWIKQGAHVLLQELAEQFFPDGVHVERSVLYQNILVKHLADVLALLRCVPTTFPAVVRLQNKLETLLPRMWQAYLSWGGDLPEPPLWGDTAIDMMYPAQELRDYLNSLSLELAVPDNPVRFVSPSGYAFYRNAEELLVFDGGPLGPDYQPGHAHCDTLSITYHFQGQPVLVDAGLGNYEETPLRQRVRSATSHNTVVVNQLPQAECWKVFRMGRRIHPEPLEKKISNEYWEVTGSYHHTWAPASQRYYHQRSVRHHPEGFWSIHDVIRGQVHSVAAYFHFHPAVQVTLRAEQQLAMLQINGTRLYLLWRVPGGQVREESGVYVPHYNTPQTSRVLILRPRLAPPVRMYYVIAPARALAAAQQFLEAIDD